MCDIDRSDFQQYIAKITLDDFIKNNFTSDEIYKIKYNVVEQINSVK